MGAQKQPQSWVARLGSGHGLKPGRSRERKGGREGRIDERKEEFREGGKDGWREERMEGERKGWREGGTERGRKVSLDVRKNSRWDGDRKLRTGVGRKGDTEPEI